MYKLEEGGIFYSKRNFRLIGRGSGKVIKKFCLCVKLIFYYSCWGVRLGGCIFFLGILK